jgi:diguanylate cyclase (GGDEF)-like protein/PAS domain S-box-containing protein
MLDIKTLIFANIIINIINAFVIAIIWRQYRKNFHGLLFFLVDMVFQAVGFFLIFFRGVFPDVLTIVFANAFLITGALFVLVGFERFFGMKQKNIHNYVFLALFICVIVYFSLFQSNLSIREIGISASIIFIIVQICWLLFRRVDLNFRRITRLSAFVFLAYILISFIRIIVLTVFPASTNNFFNSGVIGSISIAVYMLLSILITMSIILLVNTRLLMDVQDQREKYNTTFDSSPYAIILTRLSDGKIFEVNKGFVKLTGYQPSDVIGESTLSMKLWAREEDRAWVVNELSKGNNVQETEMQFRKKSGDKMTGLLSSAMIMINNEKAVITTVSDITEFSRMRNELHDLAMHDFLTGLPNRKLYYDRFIIAAANANRNNKKLAVISMDVDLFKSINDIDGHDTGDQVLVAISSRLNKLLRKADTIARFGGDEFVLLIWDIDSRSAVVKVVGKIRECLSAPINIDEHPVQITTSMGIALYPEDGDDIKDLIKKSDKAMYYVKESGRDNYQFFGELNNCKQVRNKEGIV